MRNNGSFVFDTNVIIDFLKNTSGVVNLADLIKRHECFVSVITKLELLKFPKITAEEEVRISDFLALVPVVPVNTDAEKETIAISRVTKLKLPDAIIATTAIVHEASVVTRNFVHANTRTCVCGRSPQTHKGRVTSPSP